MSDIAQAECVSVTTVSYVVNGRGDAMRIPAKTQQRILARCKAMNYSRDYLAAAMASRRTQTIGVVFTNALGDFMNQILWGVHEALRQENQEVLLCLTEDNPATEAEDIAMLEHRHVDGIIAFPVVGKTKSGRWGDLVAKDAPPVVFVDSLPPGVAGACVRIDDFAAGREVAQKASALGIAEAVVVVPARDALTLQERMAGFQTGAAHAGIKIAASLPADDPGLVELLATANRSLGVFGPRASALIRPLQSAFAAGRLAPSHTFFSVGEAPEAAFLPNPWWMLQQPARDMGRTAARLVLERIGGDPCNKSTILLPTSWTSNRAPAPSPVLE